jgi:hypothetical protein
MRVFRSHACFPPCHTKHPFDESFCDILARNSAFLHAKASPKSVHTLVTRSPYSRTLTASFRIIICSHSVSVSLMLEPGKDSIVMKILPALVAFRYFLTLALKRTRLPFDLLPSAPPTTRDDLPPQPLAGPRFSVTPTIGGTGGESLCAATVRSRAWLTS